MVAAEARHHHAARDQPDDRADLLQECRPRKEGQFAASGEASYAQPLACHRLMAQQPGDRRFEVLERYLDQL